MKTLVCLTLVAGAMASPALSFAQSALTRAQVNAELVRLEQAGYDPSNGEYVYYPADIQAAEAKIAAQDMGRATVGDAGASGTGSTASAAPDTEAMSVNSVGGGLSGSAASGSRMPSYQRPVNQCVGPAGFCVPFFGG